jgi:hypothetical protein
MQYLQRNKQNSEVAGKIKQTRSRPKNFKEEERTEIAEKTTKRREIGSGSSFLPKESRTKLEQRRERELGAPSSSSLRPREIWVSQKGKSCEPTREGKVWFWESAKMLHETLALCPNVLNMGIL